MERASSLGEGLRLLSQPKERRLRGCRAGRKVQEKKDGIKTGGIFNLSDTVLSYKETNILHLGLKCGLKRPINKFDVFIDIHKYMCKVNMKKYFLNKNSEPTTGTASVALDSGLRNKSLFNPLNKANQ